MTCAKLLHMIHPSRVVDAGMYPVISSILMTNFIQREIIGHSELQEVWNLKLTGRSTGT